MSEDTPKRVLIVGGGTVGLGVALRLQRRLKSGKGEIVLVDPLPHMTSHPMLPEVAAGSLDPRRIVVPIASTLRRARVVHGRLARLEHADRRAWIEKSDGTTEELDYDIVVMAAGAVTRLPAVPGLAEDGLVLRTVADAEHVRDHVLDRIEAAARTRDPKHRERLLTIVVVGGGRAGVAVAVKLQALARRALASHDDLAGLQPRVLLVEQDGHILPGAGRRDGARTVQRLTEEGVTVHLGSTVESMVEGNVRLSEGTTFGAETVVWTPGFRPNPVLFDTDLPLDPRGRLRCTSTLQVAGEREAFGGGDIAAVPDLMRIDEDPTATCARTAQHAARQAKVLADNVVACIGEVPMRQYRLSPRRRAVVGRRARAERFGMGVEGAAAGLQYRADQMVLMPTLSRRLRLGVHWTLARRTRGRFVAAAAVDRIRPSGAADAPIAKAG